MLAVFLLSPAFTRAVPDKPHPGDTAAPQIQGLWKGVHHAPTADGVKFFRFEMFLVQDGPIVAGFIKEPNTFGKRQEPSLHAVIKGRVDEKTGKLTFTKTYDGTAGEDHQVAYDGAPGRGGSKFEGAWKQNGVTGRFTLEKAGKTGEGACVGIWMGTYQYAGGNNAVNFSMIVVHDGADIMGLMKEPNTFGNQDEPWLHAGFKGRVDENGKMLFIKTYDGTAGVEHSIHYGGTPSADKAKVDGSWGFSETRDGGQFTLQRLRLDKQTVESLK
jgi:hypothetical protein